MASNSKYLLDSDALMQANRAFYSFDICPGFWEALIGLHESDRIFSLDRVRTEIDRGKDRLTDWARKEAPKSFFLGSRDNAVITSYQAVAQWVNKGKFFDQAKAEFLAGADGWLIAYAEVNEMTVVTQEVYAPGALKKVPIPNVAEAFDVPCLNLYDMLSDLNVKFYWDQS